VCPADSQIRHTARAGSSARPHARCCQDLMGHVRPRFRYQDYPVAAPIHRGSATGRQAASGSWQVDVGTLLEAAGSREAVSCTDVLLANALVV
jgi:hypothetical protein